MNINTLLLIAASAFACAPTLLQASQIAPNPNPSGNTIQVSYFFNTNNGTFDNYGEVILLDGYDFDNSGVINNYAGAKLTTWSGSFFNNYAAGMLNNQVGGIIDLRGELNNFGGTLNNASSLYIKYDTYFGWFGSLKNYFGGTVNNSGTIQSAGELGNYGGTLNNSGELWAYKSLINTGKLNNSGTLVSSWTGHGTINLDNTGTLNNSGKLYNKGWAANNGILNNQAGATISNESGAGLGNTGVLNNAAGATLTSVSGANLGNYASLNNQGVLTNDGQFTNKGTLSNSGEILGKGAYIQRIGQTINTGSMTQATVDIFGGSLSGSGTITGNVTLWNEATLMPGNSPGTMTINGNFSSSGNSVFEIGGKDPGQFDVLAVNGSTSFTGGAIRFDFINSFHAMAGDHWLFLATTQGVTGWQSVGLSFLGANGLNFAVTESASGLTLNVLAVPEPETYALFLAGLGLMATIARRRKQAA